MKTKFAVIISIFLLAFIFFNRSQEIDLDQQIPEPVLATFFDNMQTMPSGLKYRIVRAGTGRQPQPTDRVKVHYRGFLKNGKVFDSSYRVGNPAIFQVNAVIKGWSEALLNMKEGAIWDVYIPSELAYGSTGAGNLIGPDTDLCFHIEFIKVY